MKEVIVFVVIVILALAFFSFIQGAQGLKNTGASIIKALNSLNFGFVKTPAAPVAPTAPAAPAAPQTTPTSQPKTPSSVPSSPTKSREEIKQELKEVENKIERLQEELQEMEKPGPKPLSPYYQKIIISGVKAKNNTSPSLITLRTNAKEEINITGFIVKTRHGELEIPQGVEKYLPDKPEKDIIIKGSMSIYVIGESSPLAGVNFRLNKCMGYLKNYQTFYPSFSSYCPKPTKQELSCLTPICEDYILKLGTCKIPDYSNNTKIATNSSCVSYINENLNYAGCYKNYSQDQDFLKNYWYIYAKSDIVEPLHDTVYLYDQNGYLIDDYLY